MEKGKFMWPGECGDLIPTMRMRPRCRQRCPPSSEAQVDQTSRLHVLHQNGARSFNYSVVDPDGREVVKEIYLYTQTRPVLRGDGEGKVYVAGGMRRPDSNNANASPVPAALPAELGGASGPDQPPACPPPKWRAQFQLQRRRPGRARGREGNLSLYPNAAGPPRGWRRESLCGRGNAAT